MENRLLSTKEVASLISFSERTLKTWRQSGSGPRFFLIGRSVRYDCVDVERWLAAQSKARRRARGAARRAR